VSASPYSAEDFNGVATETVRLYALGHSQAYIASKLSLTPAKVRGVLDRAFEEVAGDKREQVQQVAGQLLHLSRKVMERIEEGKGFFDRKDLELMLKLIERRCRLFGLDAPTRVETRLLDELSDAELIEQARRLNIPVDESRFRALPAAEVELGGG
jgi:hypothetical protein